MLSLDKALGIGMQGENLVFATLSRGFQEFALERCAVLERYRELSFAELQSWVQEYLQAHRFSPENVVLGLPRSQVVVRQIELPIEVEENLDQVIRLQVEKFEPLEEGNSSYDCSVLHRDPEQGKVRIQILMVRREYLEEQLNFFRELKLYPTAVRFSGIGLYQLVSRRLRGSAQRPPALLIDINPGELELLALGGPLEFLSAAVPCSGEELTADGIMDHLDRFLSRGHFAHQEFSALYLSGALAEGVLGELRGRFPECELIGSGLNLKGNRVSGASLDQCADAIGLAMSQLGKALPAGRFNLIPAERRITAERPGLLPTLALAGLLVMLTFGLITHGYFQRRGLLHRIEGQIQALRPEAEEAMALRLRIDEQRAELTQLQDLMKGRQKVLEVVAELTERIPDDSYLQALNIQGERVSLTGFSESASTLLKILLNSESLTTVESRYITPDRTMKDREKFSFEARIRQ